MNLKFNHDNCSGCGVCKLACSIKNFNQVNPSMALLRIHGVFPDPGKYHIYFCDQCGICADSCPADAIEIEEGMYTIDEDVCTACHECVDACPHSVMTIKKADELPAKCILCGECATVCPRQAIYMADTQEKLEVI